MSTNPRTRKSPRLLLYGIVFRILCSVAFHASDGAPSRATEERDPCHRAPRKERSPLSLHLDPGR